VFYATLVLEGQPPSSSSGFPWLLVPVVAIAVLAFFAFRWWHREQAFGRFAATHAMTFIGTDLGNVEQKQLGVVPLDELPLTFLTYHRAPSFEDFLIGQWKGVPERAAHFRYAVGPREHSHTVHFTVVVAQYPMGVPEICIVRRGALVGLLEFLGGTGLKFESDEFNRRFHVTCSDEAFAYKFLDPRLMQWLLLNEEAFPIILTLAESYALFGTKWIKNPERLVPHLDAAVALRDQIPRLVWSEYGRTLPPITGTVAS